MISIGLSPLQFEGEAAEKSCELSTVREKLRALEERNRDLTSQHSSLDQSLQASGRPIHVSVAVRQTISAN